MPTVTGTVTSYTVTPSLPAGLTLNGSTGIISGTPTAATPSVSYTVTAANAGGAASATLTIVVNLSAPVFSYASSHYSYTVGIASDPIKPVNTGGAASSWSISPTLPAGLTFDGTSGTISGTPSQAAAANTFTVKAMNTAGSEMFAVTIAVAAAPLLDLGHVNAITTLSFPGTYALSADDSGHWVLWNFATATQLASGTASCIVDSYDHVCIGPPVAIMAGSTILIVTPSGLELRSAPNGQVTSEIATTGFIWVTLASDGSYACAGSSTALSCWNPAGQQLFIEAGNYASAKVFAAPNQLRVALGARGSNVIETVATSTWTASIGPAFNGTFSSWFTDGASFITTTPATGSVWIYSASTVQLDQRSLPALTNLTGQGSWFWTFAVVNLNSTQQPLNIYKVGNSSLPTASYSFYESSPTEASGLALAVFDGATPGTVSLIDLSGATPSKATYSLPIDGFNAFGAVSASQWLIGNLNGVLLDGSGLPAFSRFLDYGKAWSIVGGGPRVVISTASGRIISYATATNTLETTITQQGAELAISSDGSVLASAASHFTYGDELTTDRSIYVYSMPAATQIASFPFSYTYGVNAPVLNEMSLSADGSTIGEISTLGNTSTAQALKVQNATPTLTTTSGTWGAPLRLSPDGTLAAFTNIAPTVVSGSPPATSIYQNGTLTTSLSGWSVGWLDDARLLVISTRFNGSGGYDYLGASLYGPTGTLLANPPLPGIDALQPLGGDQIYAPGLNEILSVTSGMPTWASANMSSGLGAVTSTEVVFLSGTLLLAEPH